MLSGEIHSVYYTIIYSFLYFYRANISDNYIRTKISEPIYPTNICHQNICHQYISPQRKRSSWQVQSFQLCRICPGKVRLVTPHCLPDQHLDPVQHAMSSQIIYIVYYTSLWGEVKTSIWTLKSHHKSQFDFWASGLRKDPVIDHISTWKTTFKTF